MFPLVSVSLVTYNSARFIDACLASLFAQDYRPLEVIIVDNASSDSTAEVLARYAGRIRVIRNAENRGFSAAHNQAIAVSRGKWVLVLNPDVRLTPAFISRLVENGEEQTDQRVGTVCGKLLAMGYDMRLPPHPLVDSTGIFFTPTLRHFDRGARQPDNGKFEQPEYVFGASAAAALYRREMIDDLSIEGEFFDSDFFFYREDADVAWRAQLMDWKCLYLPQARAYHVRTVQPGNRGQLPPEINMHSVKNRFLMRLKNVGPWLYLRNLVPTTVRDLGVLAYCLLVERTSLPAFGLLWRAWPRAWRKRQWIQEHRRVDDRALARWFRFHPVAFPAVNGHGQESGARSQKSEVTSCGLASGS
jgi:GT2 family glycosyltransferase